MAVDPHHPPTDAPPGPRLPGLVQGALFLLARDPVRRMARYRRRYGPVFRVKPAGVAPIVYVTTPELAHAVYSTDSGIGRAAEIRRVIEVAVGPNSLLRLEGEPWKRHRKLLNPVFHGRAIDSYRDEIAEIAAREVDSWPHGEPFALRPGMQNITLEVILRLVFGVRDHDRLNRLRIALAKLVDVAGSNAVLVLPPSFIMGAMRSPLLRRLPFSPVGRFVAARERVDALLYEEIAERRAAPVPGATDVLSRLLAARDDDGRPMTDIELRDELVTFLEAGHETTATALAWAFERLLRRPDVLARLRAELEAGHEEYLEAVAKEALRVRPVVFAAPRMLTAPLQLGEYEVPAGWFVSPYIPLIHHDPATFPAPEDFRPERFLAGRPGEEEARQRAQRGWMPFGGGRRYCIGAQLALLEMKVIIWEILRRVDLTVTDLRPEPPRVKHVTLVPARQTRLVANARIPGRPPTSPLAPPQQPAS